MNLLRIILKKIQKQYRLISTRRRWTNEEKKYLTDISFPELTKGEIAKIKEVWKNIPFDKNCLNGYRFYKKIHGFDARYLSMPIYDPLIIRILNPFQDACVFVNKGFFDVFFADLKQPELFIKRIDDHYFDCQSNVIGKEEYLDILDRKEKFIIKPSVNSHGGTGIVLVKSRKTQKEIESLIAEYGGDFIVQEII